MNQINDLIEAIEKPQFAAKVNIASNLKTFLRAVAEQPEIQEIKNVLTDSKTVNRLKERSDEIRKEKVQSQTEHPRDTALATILWLLFNQDRESAVRIAYDLTHSTQFWWASRIAEDILRQEKQYNEYPTTASQTAASSPFK